MKSEKTNMGKGVQPTSNTLYYRMDMPDGSTKYATIPAYTVDKLGRYKAWVTHPDFGTELMTEREGRLEGFKPVVALTTEDLPHLVAAVTAAVMEKLKGVETEPTEGKPGRKPRAKATAQDTELDPLDLVE